MSGLVVETWQNHRHDLLLADVRGIPLPLAFHCYATILSYMFRTRALPMSLPDRVMGIYAKSDNEDMLALYSSRLFELNHPTCPRRSAHLFRKLH